MEWLERLDEIERLEGAWRDLEAAVAGRTIFSGFDHAVAWYRNYGGAYGDPLVGAAWDGGRLLGIAPLAAHRASLGGIPVRRIDCVGFNAGDCGELLVADGRPDVAGVLLGALIDAQPFDVVRLSVTATASPSLAALRDAGVRRRVPIEMAGHAYVTVELDGGYDHYCRRMGGGFRRGLRRGEAKIAAAGEARVDGLLFGDRASNVAEPLARALAISDASHKKKMGSHHRGFYEEIVRRFAPRGMIDLAILTLAGTDAAFLLGIVERQTYYDVSASYVEAFSANSPGSHLLQLALRRLAEHGVRTMVSHGAHEYKRRWATEFVPVVDAYFFSRGLKGRLSRRMKFHLQPLGDRVRARLGAQPSGSRGEAECAD